MKCKNTDQHLKSLVIIGYEITPQGFYRLITQCKNCRLKEKWVWCEKVMERLSEKEVWETFGPIN